MNALWEWTGGGAKKEENEGADAVDRLCDRIATSTLLEDRRDAVRGLKDLAKTNQLEVGTQGMDIVMQVLQNDRSDVEIVRFALETLAAVFKTSAPEGSEPDDNDLGVGFTEMFVKHREYVSLLLSLLEEYDFYVRFHTVQVLTMLVNNRKTRLQELVAFENAFERLLDIVHEEGNSDGGIIVQDCLHLIHNLLARNPSNQNYFRETSGIKRLTPFILGTPVKAVPQFTIPGQEDKPTTGPDSWEPQKVTNMLMMLELVRILLVAGSPSTLANQNALARQGALDALLKGTLNDSQLPPRVRVSMRICAAEAISGCAENQSAFMAMAALDGARPRPVVVALVIDMLAFRNPFDFRCASLYCLEALCHKNPDVQQFMVSTLNQPPNANLMQATDTPLAAGAQLLAALQDTTDGISHWFACLAVANQIRGNKKAKDTLLSIQVHRPNSSPSPLLTELLKAFSCTGMQQARVWCAELVLLITLCMEHPVAISTYLTPPDSLTFLIQQAQQPSVPGPHSIIPGLASLLLGVCMQWTDGRSMQHTRASLLHVVHNMVGTDRFVDNLSALLKHEVFVRATQPAMIMGARPDEVWLDTQFTALARRAKDDIMATVTMPQQDALQVPVAGGAPAAPVDPETQVANYKKLIREKDDEVKKLTKQIAELQRALPPPPTQLPPGLEQLRIDNAALKAQVEDLKAKFSQLQSEQDDLLVLLAEQDTQKKVLKQRLQGLGQEVSEDEEEEEEEE